VAAPTITLYPAIDIRDGRAVRLLQGNYSRETTYDADPAVAARRWLEGGAAALHVVDLDGARQGAPQNLETVRGIVSASQVPVQVGGGLREAEAVTAVLEAGASRAVLGTRAQRDPDFMAALVAEHGRERIVGSVDARAGKVAVEGWERGTGVSADRLITQLTALGVGTLVYTPVEVDGTLEGPGLSGLETIADACAAGGAELIYSGGIGSLAHLGSLREIAHPAITGVIVGRALYERRFSVAEAISALSGERVPS
jgi:phosphoribosylformimino-5-aminoimidazole carboxamide ribotide isomerase